MAEARYCKNCGFAGIHRIASEISSGQWLFLVLTFLCFIIPGFIYGGYLLARGGSNKFWVCPQCRARSTSLPVDSPLARAEMAANKIEVPDTGGRGIFNGAARSLGRLVGKVKS